MKLFLDLDGVMFDFKRHFFTCFGLHTTEVTTKKLWQLVGTKPNFFADLPLCSGALHFFHKIEHLSPVILTSCPNSNYESVAQQKRSAVRKSLSRTCMILPVSSGKYKALFLDQPGDVLIDDYPPNLYKWEEAGGYPILHNGDFGRTMHLLFAHWERSDA